MSKKPFDSDFDAPPPSPPRTDRAILSAKVAVASTPPQTAAPKAQRKHFNCLVDADIQKAFKQAAVRSGRSMTDIVEDFMVEYSKQHK